MDTRLTNRLACCLLSVAFVWPLKADEQSNIYSPPGDCGTFCADTTFKGWAVPIAMKTCRKCKTLKPLDDYYTHPRMGDGYLNICKECVKAGIAANIEKRKQEPQWRQKERERGREKMRLARAEGRDKKATPEARRATLQRFYEKHKLYKKAHSAAQRAVKKGLIIKPATCESCGKMTADLEKHHPDYARPLFIQWLCTTCHGETRHVNEVIVASSCVPQMELQI